MAATLARLLLLIGRSNTTIFAFCRRLNELETGIGISLATFSNVLSQFQLQMDPSEANALVSAFSNASGNLDAAALVAGMKASRLSVRRRELIKQLFTRFAFFLLSKGNMPQLTGHT